MASIAVQIVLTDAHPRVHRTEESPTLIHEDNTAFDETNVQVEDLHRTLS